MAIHQMNARPVQRFNRKIQQDLRQSSIYRGLVRYQGNPLPIA